MYLSGFTPRFDCFISAPHNYLDTLNVLDVSDNESVECVLPTFKSPVLAIMNDEASMEVRSNTTEKKTQIKK